MGLSSKQVSGDAFDWAKNLMQTGALELPNIAQMRQQHQQQQQQQQQMVPPLKCPRCESSNTKFCYYNNYNRSQPRHFCKSCRRHWTKGGTLRNVPVGGGRKNKRQKITHNTNTNTTKNIENGTKVAIEPRHQQQQTQEQGLAFGDEKNLNEILYQSLLQPSSTCINNNSNNSFFGNMGTTLSLDSLLPLPNFPCTSLSSLDNNPSSSMASRCQYPNALNYIGKTEVEEDHSISTSTTMPWQTPVTSSSIDPSVYWNWEDLNTLISTDLKTSWDSQNKQ